MPSDARLDRQTSGKISFLVATEGGALALTGGIRRLPAWILILEWLRGWDGGMRVGLITDTHIPDMARELPGQIADIFSGVDLILHAGDIYSLWVLDELERIAPVLAALGDDDHFSLAMDRRVKPKHVLDLEGRKVWLMHEGPWPGRMPFRQEGHTPDILVHGHTHEAQVRPVDGVLLVGSGSPTFLRYRRGPGTVAILDISPGGVEAHIVKLDDV